MYLQQMYLENVACFDALHLDFMQSDGDKPCQWVVLLGENGAGKSTILQMLALALLGRDMVYEIAGGVDWTKLVRRSKIKGRMDVTLLAKSADRKRKRLDKGFQSHYRAAFELGRSVRTGLSQDLEAAREDYEKLVETLYSDSLTGGWFACGYGPWRRLPRHKSPARSSRALTASERKPYRFATMFDEESALTLAGNWLVDLDFRRLKEPENQAAQRAFDLATQTLEKVLPGVEFKAITPEGDVIFSENNTEVSVDDLSDGYRGTMAWVGDLVRRLVDAFPRMENPLTAEGVVLVDELDTHLHPKWQRLIVDQVRRIFPNLQFIVSSHSPFIAQGMRAEDKIIVLKKSEGVVVAQEGSDSVQGWRVDQILTSDLFDLETTRDLGFMAVEQEYQQLLDSRATGEFTSRDKQRLQELKAWLCERQSPPGETVEDNELYDAAQALIGILDEQLSRQLSC